MQNVAREIVAFSLRKSRTVVCAIRAARSIGNLKAPVEIDGNAIVFASRSTASINALR